MKYAQMLNSEISKGRRLVRESLHSKIEGFKKVTIDSALHFEHHRKVAAVLDNHLDRFVLLKLLVDSLNLDFRLETVNRAHNLNLSLHSLVVDVLNDQTHVFVDAVI